MISHFGSLRTVLSASEEALASAAGPDAGIAAQIVAARQLGEVACREALAGQAVCASDAAFQRYLVQRIGLFREEFVLVIYLNPSGLFLAEDCFGGLQSGASTIPARQAMRRAFELDARRLLIAHNHPSGQLRPSEDDITATRDFTRLLALAEIHLEDHCIVSGSRVLSMRDQGYLA